MLRTSPQLGESGSACIGESSQGRFGAPTHTQSINLLFGEDREGEGGLGEVRGKTLEA